MTTIAYDGTTLACDTRIGSETARDPGPVQKAFILPDGSIVAGAGSYQDLLEFVEWGRGGFNESDKPTISDGFDGIHVTSNGRARWCENKLIWWPVRSKTASIGSGNSYAMAAMSLGYDARTAVKTASKFDSMTGGPIRVFRRDRGKWKKAGAAR